MHIKATEGASDFGPSETRKTTMPENSEDQEIPIEHLRKRRRRKSLLFQIVFEKEAADPEQVITKRVRICR